MRDSKMDTCAQSASVHSGKREEKAKPHPSNNAANIDKENCIGCTKEDKPMQTDVKSALSPNDVLYIRNLLAEGIARMLVEKVAKNTVPDVDESEPERYNPSPSKKEVS